MAEKNSKKINIPMRMATILLFLTLFTTHFTGGLYARYVTTDSATDIARVAKFDIKCAGDALNTNLNVPVAPGTYGYELTIENNSEVDVNYNMIVENITQNIPFEFSIYNIDVTEDQFNVGSINFNDTLNVNSAKKYILKIHWSQTNATKYINMVDLIKVTVITEQID